MSKTAACIVVSTLAVLGSAAPAQAGDGSYSAVVVQNRKHTATHELTTAFGVLPMNAFTKGVTLSGAYTISFSDTMAWEVVHAFDSFHVDTALRSDLDAFGLQPTPFEVLNYLVTSNFVFKPVYWKGAWLNNSVVYGELMLLGGGGYGWFTRSRKVAVDGGLAMRLYFGDTLSVRFDVRHNVFFDDSVFEGFDLRHELWTGLGVSFAL